MSSAAISYPHITVDKEGVVRLGTTRYKVLHLAGEHYHHGWSGEELLRQHPDLRPEEVYAALTYFYDHFDEMVAQLQAQAGAADALRVGQRLTRAELLARKKNALMPVKYYMDVHIPAGITAGLRRRQIDVATSQEDGTQEHSDESLLRRASELGRVLFSQDQDFLTIARRWQTESRHFIGLIFSSQHVSIGRIVADLDLVAHCCAEVELANNVFYLPLP